MPTARAPFVLFAAAAGPELGFGHLVRCGVIASSLGASRELALRGTSTAIHAALRLGWTVHQGPALERALGPDLIVVDEPSPAHRDRWIRLARQAQIPAVAIFDGGSERVDADLIVDGSFTARPDHRRHRCAGPAWAVLSPTVAARRLRPLVRDHHRVLVALGGGAHIHRLGTSVARAIVEAVPGVVVDLASGFAAPGRQVLPAGCRWIHAPHGLTDHMASAGVAVVAGGITLYEACALETPAVVVPVVEAQRPAIDAAVAARVVTAGAPLGQPITPASIAEAVRLLVESRTLAASRAAAAARLVDGAGAMRVVAKLKELVRIHARGARHAA